MLTSCQTPHITRWKEAKRVCLTPVVLPQIIQIPDGGSYPIDPQRVVWIMFLEVDPLAWVSWEGAVLNIGRHPIHRVVGPGAVKVVGAASSMYLVSYDYDAYPQPAGDGNTPSQACNSRSGAMHSGTAVNVPRDVISGVIDSP
jgi:hypothetical protein